MGPCGSEEVDGASFAPLFRAFGFGSAKTSVFYWRVAAVDSRHNVGNFTKPATFRFQFPSRR